MNKKFVIYHRPTDTYSTYPSPSRWGFLSKDGSLPKLYDSERGCKRALTNYISYCKQYFKNDLEFCLGLEVAMISVEFEIEKICHKQILSLEKI